MIEEWKPIANTHGMIEVSNYGRVRSLLRGKPFVLKTQTDNKGYHRVRTTIDRQKMSFKVHREVAKAFIPNPNNLPQVNHISGNKSDNSVSNLEWCDNLYNVRHAVENGLWANVFEASKRTNEKHKTPVIATNGFETLRFESVSDAERHFGTRHISDVLNGKREHCKGYTFRREGVTT